MWKWITVAALVVVSACCCVLGGIVGGETALTSPQFTDTNHVSGAVLVLVNVGTMIVLFVGLPFYGLGAVVTVVWGVGRALMKAEVEVIDGD